MEKMMNMKDMLRTSLLMMIVMTVLMGLVYPLAMTGISLVLFPGQAKGSLIYREGKPAGSRLIGQSFSSGKYLHGRPSAAGEKGYDGLASGGTNLGPTNRHLVDNARKNQDAVVAENNVTPETKVPSDLVFASASGHDPHISPRAAYFQAGRIAQARGISPEQVRKIIDGHVEKPFLWCIGEPVVNVLLVNMALDSLPGQ
jgi:K+-transporting ATPase ATPase C chain